jgi:ribonuclease Z
MAAAWGISVERATVIVNAAHTTPITAGKVFDLVQPRMAGLWHTIVAPHIVPQVFAELRKVYDGPVAQTQDLTVFNITEQAVVTRQAQVSPQTMPIPGKPRIEVTPRMPAIPDWWAEALIPIDDVLALA